MFMLKRLPINVLYQVCVFWADQENKMATLASDLLKNFFEFSEMLNGIQLNFTESKILMYLTNKMCDFQVDRKPRWLSCSIRQQGGTLYSGARYVALWAPCYTNFALLCQQRHKQEYYNVALTNFTQNFLKIHTFYMEYWYCQIYHVLKRIWMCSKWSVDVRVSVFTNNWM